MYIRFSEKDKEIPQIYDLCMNALGEEFLDTVTVGSAAIKGQSLGASLLSEGFDGVDGILGCVGSLSYHLDPVSLMSP